MKNADIFDEDILDSKIKKVRIELPHFSFSHSSSGESSHTFIGRKRIKEKLKKIVEATTDKTGIYLVTGNRGVGKTSLVSWVITETSLQPNFSKKLKYWLILLFFVVVTQFCLQKFNISTSFCSIYTICVLICALVSLFILGLFSGYRRKIHKQNIFSLKFLKEIFISAFKELLISINLYNPYRPAQYILRIILIVGYTQIISMVTNITPTKAFVFYSFFIFTSMFWRVIKDNLHKYYQKYMKEGLTNKNIHEIGNYLRFKSSILKCIFSPLILLSFPLVFGLFELHSLWWYLFIFIIVIVAIGAIVFSCSRAYFKEGIQLKCWAKIMLRETILIPFWNYIKNHRRLYLRINFGHKLKDEKDILRLITRTLSTEYHKYLRSFKRMLPWRVMAFGFLLLFAYLFSTIVEKQEFYKSIKDSKLYQASSQVHLNYAVYSKDSTYLKVKDFIYVKKDSIHAKRDSGGLEIKVSSNNSIYLKVIHIKKDSIYLKAKDFLGIEKDKERLENAFTNDNYHFNKAETFLLVLDQLVFEISKRVKKIPQLLLCEDEKIDFNKEFVPPINYLFWLSFFLMYLLCVLLFRCNWITHFFVTNRIIKRQLKILNSDITYSTELEKSVNIKSGDIGTKIGAKTKKSRGVADAREIEKELQDILDNVQRIPVFMCRPNFIIVFDELDKVEPGESNSEKENQQTKASLFSIDATREKQTEILKILSNMKYFLSTAKAKFIFIAGREMHDIYLADVSERNNYIGSIFNAVIYVPSFLTDHFDGIHSDMTSLTEEFVCRRLIPRDYPVESYNLKNYREYLEEEIYNDSNKETKQKIHKIIAVLQQFIIYLAHVSKGAPKEMMQIFESFIEVHKIDKKEDDSFLIVQRYHNSQFFLIFNYYKQYIIGIIAYLITPIFNRLSESNINKEHSDKLLVSSLRFIDFLFKFHKHPFSWKHLDISPEMLEVNHSPELKSIVVDLVDYLAKIHINKPNFSLSDYRFDNLIAYEIFAMTKTDEGFSALFSFSLDEMLPLKKHYQDLLEETQKEYQNNKNSLRFIDAISSLQVVLGDLHYYDDELEEAGVYYKNAVQVLSNLEGETMTLEQHYLYVRNMLRLGMIYENRKQYDFAYLTYGEICKRIIRGIAVKGLISRITLARLPGFKRLSPKTNDTFFKKMTYEGLKILYLPFIAKLQILEKSHVGGITPNHLERLEKEFEFMTKIIDHKEAKLLEAEFYSHLADILYYKNSDLKRKKKKNRKEDNDEDKNKSNDEDKDIKNYSCTACYYYHKALSILLDLDKIKDKNKNTVIELLSASVERIDANYNMKYCTILARILSDWGNVFFSCDAFPCDDKQKNNKYEKDGYECYICDAKDCNTRQTYFHANLKTILEKYINYVESESEEKHRLALLGVFNSKYNFSKMEIAFAMYAISLKAYTKSNLYKRSAYQIFKMLRLFKYYEIYDYIGELGQKAIRSLWQANEELNIFEINKRKKDFDKHTIEEKIPLQYILVDSEINRIMVLVKDLELKSDKTKNKATERFAEKLNEYYSLYITSPYGIIYSIPARIYQLRLKATVNYETYEMLIYNKRYEKERIRFWAKNYECNKKKLETEIKFILNEKYCNDTIKTIFNVGKEKKIEILERLIAETIFCFKEIIRLSKTIGETYLFNHIFMGSIHEKLSFWIRLYEIWRKLYEEEYKNKFSSRIGEYFKKYISEKWEEQLSGHYESQQALSHYYKCLETHKEGRAYHNMIDNMCYLKDDYNDRSDHFSIAEERHNILNGEIEEKIERLKERYENSGLYDADNYLYKEDNH